MVFPLSLIRKSVRSFHPRFPSAEGRERYIRLDLNEISGLHPISFLRTLSAAGEYAINTYPTYADLVPAVAAYAKAKSPMIRLTNGSDDAIPRIARLLFEPGDTVVLPVPTFPTYNESLRLHGVSVKEIAYETAPGRFLFPTGKTLADLKRGVKGLLVCNPGNPMGSRISQGDLLRLARKTFALGIPFVVDEAYFEYGGESAIPLIKRFPNIIVLRTFSKFFGLAGIRLGYVVAHPSVITEFAKITLPWDVNHPGAKIGLAALKRLSHFKSELRKTQARKKVLEEALRSHGAGIYDTFTNFSICRVPDPARFVREAKRRGVLVKSLAYADETVSALKYCVRITTPGKDTMARALKALLASLDAGAKKRP